LTIVQILVYLSTLIYFAIFSFISLRYCCCVGVAYIIASYYVTQQVNFLSLSLIIILSLSFNSIPSYYLGYPILLSFICVPSYSITHFHAISLIFLLSYHTIIPIYHSNISYHNILPFFIPILLSFISIPSHYYSFVSYHTFIPSYHCSFTSSSSLYLSSCYDILLSSHPTTIPSSSSIYHLAIIFHGDVEYHISQSFLLYPIATIILLLLIVVHMSIVE
jgi:hypothetical protein